MRIAQRRKIASPCFHRRKVDRCPQDALLLAGIRDDHAMRIDHHAPARIGKLRFIPHAIHPDHVSLIFNRPRLQQREPVLLPLRRPERDHDEKIRPAFRDRKSVV